MDNCILEFPYSSENNFKPILSAFTSNLNAKLTHVPIMFTKSNSITHRTKKDTSKRCLFSINIINAK